MTKITRNQVVLEEHARSANFIQPVAGFTREDALDPESWVHVTTILRPMDKLSVLPIDKKWYGEYVVLTNDGTSFSLIETHYRDLVAAASDNMGVDIAGYEVSWGGPSQRWRVKRLSDDKIMISGMEKADAEAWARDNAKPVSVAA